MKSEQIQMVDLRGQYNRLRAEIDPAMRAVLESCAFINGPQVNDFCRHFADYLQVPHVIPCASGTDALQIALMALDLHPGDEVIVPAFSYAAAVEAILLLGLTPVWVDVDPRTFTIDTSQLEEAITPKTRAILVVHLFGQCCDMAPLLKIATDNRLFLIEDNAQSIGADYTFPDGIVKKAGTIGHIGTTSFFPSKPLACFGDGGAMFTSDPVLAERMRMIANHGQREKYRHEVVGCNSRLDTLQAAILDVKLRHLDEFNVARQGVAKKYDEAFHADKDLLIPLKSPFSSHIYHQYTIQSRDEKRDQIRTCLQEKGIPSMIYYPLPLHEQEAFKGKGKVTGNLEVAKHLCKSVLSLPIHTEMAGEELQYIIDSIKEIL